MKSFKKTYTALVVLLLTGFLQAAELKLADPFGDGMVLQREMPVPVWGKADPDATVTVSFAGQTKTAKSDSNGGWMLKLDPLKASSENSVLTVTCGDNKSEIKDVLVGEVWVCSGQSNMEMGIGACADGQAEIASANAPEIRLRYLNHSISPVPLTRIDGSPWMACTPQNITKGIWSGFSGSAYYFGQELHKQLKVPVGLIQCAWGGSLIEPWTTPDGFRVVPMLKDLSASVDKANNDYPGLVSNYLEVVSAWEKLAREAQANHSPLPQPPAFNLPIGSETPTAIYNAMIAPWIPYAIRGAIWYQGESNCMRHDGMLYRDKMEALIQGWRKAWGEGDFPFYFAQIAPFRYGGLEPQELAKLWEAQQAALGIPKTGMAHTQDIGNIKDIHPTNKQDVGKRLARLALSRTYGQKFADDAGPSFKSLSINGDAVAIKFNNAKSGLQSRDGQPLTCFEIAGADDQFVPAEAEIAGDSVLVKSANVASPAQVRFAWSDTSEPNLMNGEKLPAAAFRTPGPVNIALKAPYTCSNPNTHNWGANGQLTDGSWVADGSHCFSTNEDDQFPKEVVVDLSEAKTLCKLKFGVPPFGSTKTVIASISEDGKTFTEVGRKEFAQDKAEMATFSFNPFKARYIKLVCPERWDRVVQFPVGFIFMTELEAFASPGMQKARSYP